MSLVEIMVAVAVSAVVLSAIVTLTIRLERWDQRFRDHTVYLTEHFRMSEMLRTDLLSAVNVRIAADESLEIDAMGDKQICYRFQPDGCARSEAASRDGQPHLDLFSIGSRRKWKIEKDLAGLTPAIIVSLAADAEESRGLQPFAVYGQLRHSAKDSAPTDPSRVPQSSAQEISN